MAIKLVKMHFLLFKNSNKYSDFWGFYVVYILITLGSIIPERQNTLMFYLSFFFGLLGFWLFFSTEGLYNTPLKSNSSVMVNSTILANSLPIGRKNYILGKILTFISIGFISIILLIPSAIALYQIKDIFFPAMDVIFHFKIAFMLILLLLLINIVFYLSKIILMQITTGNRLQKRIKIIKRVAILATILGYLIFEFINYKRIFSNFSNFDIVLSILTSLHFMLLLSFPMFIVSTIVNHTWILVPLLAAIALLQLIWVFRNIGDLDFNDL